MRGYKSECKICEACGHACHTHEAYGALLNLEEAKPLVQCRNCRTMNYEGYHCPNCPDNAPGNPAQLHESDIHRMLEIGDGATLRHPSDRYPYTVIGFDRHPNTGLIDMIFVQSDNYYITSGSAYDGSAEYEYSRNPKGVVLALIFKNTARMKGWVTRHGKTPFHLGVRRAYFAPEV